MHFSAGLYIKFTGAGLLEPLRKEEERLKLSDFLSKIVWNYLHVGQIKQQSREFEMRI